MSQNNMDKEHLRAIRINQQIGNYTKHYCKICGRELEVYEDEQSRQDYITNGEVCEECSCN